MMGKRKKKEEIMWKRQPGKREKEKEIKGKSKRERNNG